MATPTNPPVSPVLNLGRIQILAMEALPKKPRQQASIKASTLLPLKQFMASFTPLDLSAHLPFLADLFVVRNCYTNKPLFWSPLLLRFEAFDLLVSAEPDGTLSFWQGNVNTEKGLDCSPFSFGNKNELCPVWTNRTLLIKATGQQVLSACAKNKRQIKLDLDESYLHMIGSKDKKPVVRTMLYEKIDQCFT